MKRDFMENMIYCNHRLYRNATLVTQMESQSASSATKVAPPKLPNTAKDTTCKPIASTKEP